MTPGTISAKPPFNVSDWGGERLRDDKRWQYGVPIRRAGGTDCGWGWPHE
ncbi:MAG: Type I restriction-modification system, DNA-methyltransferase subunit M [Candidatus Bipolaricaulis sibiricus]|uniref:Type I restriction-modification system, DNA-methyltransferase subunit M n=1 Tax=Bipolaricaulis sibiricus TaxID=2501609 RepID=A0A410FUL8_BIPS1|nr:MAG: Type I restriction-modification system, DNA-methyltransferase subunit M [Candidatus Bipolaricaulis sibiricus]